MKPQRSIARRRRKRRKMERGCPLQRSITKASVLPPPLAPPLLLPVLISVRLPCHGSNSMCREDREEEGRRAAGAAVVLG
jgi:hypothetical protein